MDDIAQTFNTVTPVVYGGTGSAIPADARTNLGIPDAIAGDVNASFVPITSFQPGPSSAILTSYRPDTAVTFTAKGSFLYAFARYEVDNQTATVNDFFLRLRLFDNVSSTTALEVFGNASTAGVILLAAAQPSVAMVYGTLTKGRSYTLSLATAKNSASGDAVARNLRITGFNFGL